MAIAVQRDRLVPQRRLDRAAGQNTNARQLRFVRPVSPTQALVTSDHCQLQHVVAFVDSQAPGSGSVGVQAFNKTGQIQLIRQPSGAGGVSSLGFAEETTTVELPAVVAQIPDVLTVGTTTPGVFIVGWNFKADPVDTFRIVLPLEIGQSEEDVVDDPFASVSAVEFVPDPEGEGLTVAAGATVVKATVTVDAEHPSSTAEEALIVSFLYYQVTRS